MIATTVDVTVSIVKRRTETFPRSLPLDFPIMSYWSELATQLVLTYLVVEDRVSP